MPSDCAAISPSRMATKARPIRDRMIRHVNRSRHQGDGPAHEIDAVVGLDRDPPEIHARGAKTAGPEGHRLPVPQHPLGRLCKGERGEREEDPAEPQCWEREQCADDHSQHRTDGRGRPERPAQVHLQECRSICADAVDGRIGEGELPGEADENVQPRCQNNVEQHQVADEQRVLVCERRQNQERAEEKRQEAPIADQGLEPHVRFSAPRERPTVPSVGSSMRT